MSAIRTRNSYYRAQYFRIRARRGTNKAIVAVAASLLATVYHVIRDHKPYRDLGADYFQRRDTDRIVRQSVARLKKAGYAVTLTREVA